MRKEKIQEIVVAPPGVVVSVDKGVVTVKGPKGSVTRNLSHPRVVIAAAPNGIDFSAVRPGKLIKMMFYTLVAHAKNMVEGVSKGFVYKLKVCYVHFPMTVKVDGNYLVITNFLGEKIPRKARILDGVTVKAASDVITVEGFDITKVSQTAANIELATFINRRDRRRFQDGCYITEKAGVPV